jgi:hypothetical protein
MTVLAKRQAQLTHHHRSQDLTETDNDECRRVPPTIKRVTEGKQVHEASSLHLLKKDMSKLGQNYTLCDSPQRSQPKICGIFQNPCD